MPGPLANVGTIVGGMGLDIHRLLYMGNGKTMTFLVPDTTQMDNWRTVLVLTKGFDRVPADEKTKGEGSEVIFKVADETGTLIDVLILPDLYVEVESVVYSVAQVPPVASNASQIFTLTCKTRTLRDKFFVR